MNQLMGLPAGTLQVAMLKNTGIHKPQSIPTPESCISHKILDHKFKSKTCTGGPILGAANPGGRSNGLVFRV